MLSLKTVNIEQTEKRSETGPEARLTGAVR
jgi:hypothetical protein